MRLINFLSRNPFSPALRASNYDEKVLMTKYAAFISKLKRLDKIVLIYLANRKRSPLKLIESRKKASNRQIDSILSAGQEKRLLNFQKSARTKNKIRKTNNSKRVLCLPIISTDSQKLKASRKMKIVKSQKQATNRLNDSV